MFPSPLVRTALFLGAVILSLSGCRRAATGAGVASAPQRQPVEVVNLTRRDLVETLSLVGSLAPNESAQIRTELSGQVRAVLFNEGERVAKGQVLLRIDDAELRAQLAQSEAKFRLAELNLRRSENLTEARSMSQAEADRVRSEFAAAEADLQLLRVRLAKTEIKAPFDGVVGARTISPGDYVTASTVITTLDDFSRMKIDFQVPERFAERVRPGAKFAVRAQAPGGDIRKNGEVYFTSSVIDRTTRSSQVKGYLEGDPAGLKPGMFVNIEIVLQVHPGVLTVPEGSILVTPAGNQIIIVRTEGAEKVAAFVPVQLGLRETGLVEVTPLKAGALTESDTVIASGVGALILYPGAKLEPRPLRPEFRIGN